MADGGVRSHFGFWFGGLNSTTSFTATGGYRSHFGFWFGGLCFNAGGGGGDAGRQVGPVWVHGRGTGRCGIR